MFERILIATDFSKASIAALHAGIALAKRCQAKVLAVHFVSPLDMSLRAQQPLALLGNMWREDTEKQFDEFFPTPLYPNHQKVILTGHSPSGEILNTARTEKCDLIVMGTHGHGIVARTLMGSVTQRVTRDSEIPVMVVRSIENSEKESRGFKRILVPTDFSDTSMKALDLGVRFANFLKGDLHLIHVIDWPTITLLTSGLPGYLAVQVRNPEPSDYAVDQTLKEMIAKKEFAGKVTTATMLGDPADEILFYVKKNHIDCVVMGTHGRKGLERVLLGSTTSVILGKSNVPVITISVPI